MQPVRHAEYLASPTLRDLLPLSNDVDVADATEAEALNAWSDYLGRGVPILLVSNIDRARKLLMSAFGVEEGELIGAPANARRALTESIKKNNKNFPLFIELDRDLEFALDTPGLDEIRLAWAQPVGGMAPPAPLLGVTLFVDYSYTLPAPPFSEAQELTGAATVWNLHLSDDKSKSGALIAFNDRDLYWAARELINPDEDLPNFARAVAQVKRLAGPDGIAARQIEQFMAARLGMESAAGIPMMALDGMCSLPFGLAVRVPEEADLSTFISYGRNELVPVWWYSELQPIFYVSYQVTRDRAKTLRTAEHLSRWLISPLGPDFLEEEIVHAVLVMVKAAEYTGVRWYTDPERARWYNDLMLEWYGPTHDAYRMQFNAPRFTRVTSYADVAADD